MSHNPLWYPLLGTSTHAEVSPCRLRVQLRNGSFSKMFVLTFPINSSILKNPPSMLGMGGHWVYLLNRERMFEGVMMFAENLRIIWTFNTLMRVFQRQKGRTGYSMGAHFARRQRVKSMTSAAPTDYNMSEHLLKCSVIFLIPQLLVGGDVCGGLWMWCEHRCSFILGNWTNIILQWISSHIHPTAEQQ